MSHYFRVYGHLVGLGPDQLEACCYILANYECIVAGDVLDFVHEGEFINIDSDLEALLTVLDAKTRGIVDIINHVDWEMFRCTLDKGTWTKTKIALDNALDTAYATEHRG